MPESLFQTLSQFGVLAVILALLMFAIWKIVQWFGARTDELLRAHINFVNNANDTQYKILNSISKIEERLSNAPQEIPPKVVAPTKAETRLRTNE